MEKSGTGFQRVDYLCNNQGVSWTYKKEAYGFSFAFIGSNVHLNAQLKEDLAAQGQTIFNSINDNAIISKGELALRIGKSEKTVQRTISSLLKNSDRSRGIK